MIRIAIVDDEEIILNCMRRKIINLFERMNIENEIYSFVNGDILIKECNEKHFDIIFLDIDMPDVSGIDIARKLRIKGSKVDIIFVTNKEDMVYESIKFSPFRFIRKSKFDSEIEEAIDEFINKISQKTVLKTFSTDNGKKTIDIEKIVSVEVQSHKLIIVMENKNENFIANGNLKDIEPELIQNGFIKIHQSYIVNYRYINLIKPKEIVMDNGDILPLSRSRYKSTQIEFMKLSRRN